MTLQVFQHSVPYHSEDADQEESRLAVTLDSIPDGVISTDIAGRIVTMNRAAQQLTGWALSDAKEHYLSEVVNFVDGDSGAALDSPFAAVMSSGIAATLAPNTCLISRSGRRLMIHDRTAPIRDHESAPPSGVVLIFGDDTDRQKLEVEFQQARKLEVIGRLAGGVAHEFNNLLVVIMGYSERLVDDLAHDSRLQGYARSVLETAEQVARLTTQLLALSRKGKLVSRPVNMHECITAAVKRLTASGNSLTPIETQFDAVPSATILGDSVLLESALFALGMNARDATSDGDCIEIQTKNAFLSQSFINSNSLGISAGEYFEIVFLDTGSGMTAAVLEHLYEPFFSTKERGERKGLGLAVVHGTIKAHSGAIMVRSTLGQGTEFTIYLPLCRQVVSIQNNEDLKGHRGSGCVLVVDDELLVRETTAKMLREAGYDVLLAESGSEALEIYKREQARIRWVILDVVMPRLSGPATYFALKEIDCGVKVIFSSHSVFENGAGELLSNGDFGFIQKPFRRDALYRLLQDVSPMGGVLAG